MNHLHPRPRRLEWVIQRFLGGHFNYHGNELPPRLGRLQDWLFGRFFNRVRVDPEIFARIRSLAGQGRVIYALKHRSALDFLFLHYRLRAEGLPLPEIGYGISMFAFQPFLRQLKILLSYVIHWLNYFQLPDAYRSNYYRYRLDEGAGFVTFLINPMNLLKRFIYPETDSIYNLIRLYRKRGETLVLVPLIVVFEKSPDQEERGILDIFFGIKDRPGRLRKLAQYLRYSGRAFLEMADPVTVGQFVERSQRPGVSDDQLAFELREHILGHMERQKRVITGPTALARSRLLEQVLRDPDMDRKLRQIAKEEDRPLMAVRREAARCLDEMAADYSLTMVEFLVLVLTWAWQNLFDGIHFDPNDLKRVREAAKRNPLVYVPSHKSHVDYLILSYLLVQNDMVPPHIWAGINLNFWPLGTIFRKCGAFFIRRTFRGNKVYTAVVVEYLKALLQEGYNLEFFIEGGRSRTGRLLLPKMGVVKYLVEAFHESAATDLAFVPVGIVYDQILEEGEYLQEMHGVKPVGSRLLELLRHRRIIRQRYGHMYLRIGEPISFKEFLKSIEGIEPKNGELYEGLASQIVQSINHHSVVTPISLVAAALLSGTRPGIRHTDLVEAIALLYQYLLEEEAPLAETLDNLTKAVEDAIELSCQRKLIEREAEEDGEEPLYTIPPDQRLSLEIYKNHALHFFLPAALKATALLARQNDAVTKTQLDEDCRFLKHLFRFEFVYDSPEAEARHVAAALSFFDRARHLTPAGSNGDGFQVTAKGRQELPYFAGILSNFLESYWMVLNYLERMASGIYPEKDLMSRIDKAGHRQLKTGQILRRESLNRLLYQNAFQFLAEEGILRKVNAEPGRTTWRRLPDAEPRRLELLARLEPFRKATAWR